MKVKRLLAAAVLVAGLVLLGGTAAFADESAALAKLKSAGDAADAQAAATAVAEAGAIVVADATDAGEYVKTIANDMAQRFQGVAGQYRSKAAEAPRMLEIARWRVRDFYGATIPAAKGEWQAVSDYLKARAEEAPENAKEKLLWAAAGVSEGGESSMPHMKFGVAVGLLGKAMVLAGEEKYKTGSLWVGEAADYVKLEAGFADEETGFQMSEAAASIRGLMPDMMINIPTKPKYVNEVANTLKQAMFGAAARSE